MAKPMKQPLTLTVWKFVLALGLAVVVPSAAFVITTAITVAVVGADVERLEEQQKNKVDNQLLIQYMKLIEDRNEIQKELNKTNQKDHQDILNKLEETNEKIHQLDLRLVGFQVFRGPANRWDYEELLVFAWSNDVYFNR